MVNAVLAQDELLCLSISCTTRPPRPGEIHGREYYFVSLEEFERMRAEDQLLEWACVHGNFYGTPRAHVTEAVQQGRDVILEIDWQGARQIRQHYPQALGIFILPPSLQELEHRLTRRGQDSAEVIERRMQAATNELQHAVEFEYVIINQDFSKATQELSEVIRACRLRYASQAARHATLFSQLGIPLVRP